MITDHARLARSLGEELGLDRGRAARPRRRRTSAGTAGLPRRAGRRRGSRSRPGSRTWPSSSRWPTGRTGSTRPIALARRRSGHAVRPGPGRARRGWTPRRSSTSSTTSTRGTQVIDGEPALARTLSPDECDDALAAIARFVDLKSPYTPRATRTAVASLAEAAAAGLGLPPAEQRLVRRAGLVAGFGRLGVSNAIWDKPGPLSAAEWERVRLYPALHRADAAPVRRAGAGRPDRGPGPRAARRLRLPRRARPASSLTRRQPDPRHRRGVPDDGSSRARTGRRITVGRGDRAACAPRLRAGRLDAAVVDARARAPPGARSATSAPTGRAHRPRGRGPPGRRPRPVDQGDRPAAGDQPEDRGQPHRARLHEDRRHEPAPRRALRHAARPAPRSLGLAVEGPAEQLGRDAGDQVVRRARR